jgi:predicted small lipoprotein YifL
MKNVTSIVLILLVFSFSGCSSKPPQPPEPIGEFTPVNPDNVHISELKL